MTAHQNSHALAQREPICRVHLFLAELPDAEPSGTLIPEARQKEVDAVRHLRVRKEKHYVWRLLAYALKQSMGLDMSDLSFSKDANGKWSSPDCFFSLSHAEGALAVAVSHAAVGVDIERLGLTRPIGLERQILTPTEQARFEMLTEEQREGYLIGRWTAKEAWFKAYGEAVFVPVGMDPSEEQIKSGCVSMNGIRYAWSVATSTPQAVDARLVTEWIP